MLEIGVDELTIIVIIEQGYISMLDEYKWHTSAEVFIDVIEEKLNLVQHFGNRNLKRDLPSGYDVGYEYGEHSFYFAVAYNYYMDTMGIIIKFSAQSLAYYNQVSGMKVYKIIQALKDLRFSVRLSRIDLTCDYIDEPRVTNVTEIYQDLVDKKVGIFYEDISKKNGEKILKRTNPQIKGFAKGKEIPTCYVGSSQSLSQIRIYDKKQEQIDKKGVNLAKALKVDSWIRLELVLRKKYANLMTEELKRIKDDDEFVELIASVLYHKFRFLKLNNGVVQEDADFSDILLACIGNKDIQFKSSSAVNKELVGKISYIVTGSGLMSIFAKINNIWGESAVLELADYLARIGCRSKLNSDGITWLKKNKDDYIMCYPEFPDFMKDHFMHYESVMKQNEFD